MIVSLNGTQNAELRIFQTHHLIEAEYPLRVVAQRLRPGDDADLAGAAPNEPSHERAGRSPRGDVVDPDVMMAPRAGHVGNERHDVGPAGNEIVDGRANALVVERHHGDAVIAPS